MEYWAQTLQNIFRMGRKFCLKLSQLKRMTNPDHNVYTEKVSKIRNGSCKVNPVLACSAAGERCLFRILDLYISKLPPQAFEKDLFYVRPLQEQLSIRLIHGIVAYLWASTHLMTKLSNGACLLTLMVK